MIKIFRKIWGRRPAEFIAPARSRAGVSLIIAIIFVSAFLLVMAGLLEADLKAMESMRNRDIEGKVRYLAESAAEIASYWAANNGTGQNIDSSDIADGSAAATFLQPLIFAAQSIGITNCDNIGTSTNQRSCVSFSVIGHTPEDKRINLNDDLYYSVPSAGTGDAAKKCVDADSANDECNWNRLYLGQNVEIPLYISTFSAIGEEIIDKADFSAPGSFKLRIRTPKCGRGEEGCVNVTGDEYRIELYPDMNSSDYRNVEKDPVLVQWSISDADGGSSLIAGDNTGADTTRPRENDSLGNYPLNTELSSGRINAARIFGGLMDFVVLSEDQNGVDKANDPDTISHYLGNGLAKPLLHLNMVNRPKRNTHEQDKYVPYLEYQFLSKEDPVSDSKSVIKGNAEISGFRKIITINKQRKTGISGFVLESF